VVWLPNVLTAARLAAVVPFAILLARADDAVSVGAAALFALAAFTDFLDGYLARRLGTDSRFGKIADPLADRLLIDVALVLLVWHERLEWWLAVPVLMRDVLLAALFRARRVETDVRVNFTGKTATAMIMLSLTLLMVTAEPWPKALYIMGMAVSVSAAILYYRSPEGGPASKPS
jgi:CDP-diacylglycerol--glycerol-3-phosphate 3-phosphatidyltransferase